MIFRMEIKNILYENDYYGIYKHKLQNPSAFFDLNKDLVRWPDSPSSKFVFMDNFETNVYLDQVIFENIPDHNLKTIEITIDSNKTIKFVFPNRQIFIDFSKELQSCKFNIKSLCVGKTDIELIYNPYEFRQ